MRTPKFTWEKSDDPILRTANIASGATTTVRGHVRLFTLVGNSALRGARVS